MAKKELKLNKSTNKRKVKDDESNRTLDIESPSSKFKKLDISEIKAEMMKTKKNSRSSSSIPTPKRKSQTESTTQNLLDAANVTPKKSEKRKSITSSENTPRSKKSKLVNIVEQSENQNVIAGDSDRINNIDGDYVAAAAVSFDVPMTEEDHDIREPTSHELNLAEKPENVPDIKTTRQKKKAKHQQNIQTAKVDSIHREHERNVEYLQKWQNQKDQWKFEKIRQISIQRNLFTTDTTNTMTEQQHPPLDDETWSIAIEYLAGTKGAGRDFIVKTAEEIINKIEQRINEHNKLELIKSTNYLRARELLQMLQ